MTVKKIIGKMHLWLGLLSGLVVFVVAITGCIFAFEEELFHLFHHRLVYVTQPSDTATQMPISTLKEIAQKASGDTVKINSVAFYPDRNRAVKFEIFKYDEKKAEESFWDNAGYYWKKVYVNPYTGEVNGVFDMRYEFFTTVRSIHQHLYLNYKIGSPIVGTATIIFIMMLLSGLALWWPKNKAAARQRFSFKWKPTTKWKRKNYDLHNILGFYMLMFGLFMALTGIVWSFGWWEKTVYLMLDGKVVELEFPDNPNKHIASNAALYVIDKIAEQMKKENPGFSSMYISEDIETNTIGAGANFKDNSFWTNYNYYQFDLTTGKQFASLLQKNKTTGQKWRNSNYDLHTGKTFGYTGMTFAFCTSLIIASMPITGFYIWWGRKKKKITKVVKTETSC